MKSSKNFVKLSCGVTFNHAIFSLLLGFGMSRKLMCNYSLLSFSLHFLPPASSNKFCLFFQSWTDNKLIICWIEDNGWTKEPIRRHTGLLGNCNEHFNVTFSLTFELMVSCQWHPLTGDHECLHETPQRRYFSSEQGGALVHLMSGYISNDNYIDKTPQLHHDK